MLRGDSKFLITIIFCLLFRWAVSGCKQKDQILVWNTYGHPSSFLGVRWEQLLFQSFVIIPGTNWLKTYFPEESEQVFDQWSSPAQIPHSIDRYLHIPSDLIRSEKTVPLDFRRFSDANRDSYTQQLLSIQLRNWNVTIKSEIGNDRWSTFGCKQRTTEPEVMNDSFHSYFRFRWIKNDSGKVLFFRSFVFFFIICLFALFFSESTPHGIC